MRRVMAQGMSPATERRTEEQSMTMACTAVVGWRIYACCTFASAALRGCRT